MRNSEHCRSVNASVDYDVEYTNRARVPENTLLIAGWARDAAAYRERHAPRSIPYGSSARNRIDFFPGDDKGPIVVFIHGGFCQAVDRFVFSPLPRGASAHWSCVCIPSDALFP